VTASGSPVVVAGRDPLLVLALRRSGVSPVAEVTQAELLFVTLDRYRPRVLVLSPDLEGSFDPEALVRNLAWLFPDLPVLVVKALQTPDPGPLPEAWQVFPYPPDYRRLAETVVELLASGDGGAAAQAGPTAPAGLQGGSARVLAAPGQPEDGPAMSGSTVAPPTCAPAGSAGSGLPWPRPAGRGAAGPPPWVSPGDRAPARGPGSAAAGDICATPVPPRGAAGGDAPPSPLSGSPWGWQGLPSPQVLTVCSPKGGVGKTFVAVNVAAAISARGQEVLLLDWDLPSADVSIHLNLQAGPGVLDLVNSGREVCPEVLREHLVRHFPSGLYVLKGPSRPEMAEFIGHDHLRAVLASARGSFPVVVIDTPPSPCDEALCQALEGASRILLVVVQDPACLYQARVFLDLMPRLGIHRASVGLVVNRYREGAPDARDIQAFLGMAPIALLPDDAGACRSVMQGVPYVLRHSGPLATALLELTRRIVPSAEPPGSPPERRRGWFLRKTSRRSAGRL